jgi:hypothetical protein
MPWSIVWSERLISPCGVSHRMRAVEKRSPAAAALLTQNRLRTALQ